MLVGGICSTLFLQLQDEFEPWPHRLVVQTNDSGSDVGEFLPASIAAMLLQKKTLSSSGLQILEFEGMDSLRVVARKIIRDLGYVPVCCVHASDSHKQLVFLVHKVTDMFTGQSLSFWFKTIQLILTLGLHSLHTPT